MNTGTAIPNPFRKQEIFTTKIRMSQCTYFDKNITGNSFNIVCDGILSIPLCALLIGSLLIRNIFLLGRMSLAWFISSEKVGNKSKNTVRVLINKCCDG